jgi:hypothetical protein
VGYVIAAYALVLGTLVIYGWRLQAQRQALGRRDALEEDPEARGDGAP